MSAKKQTTKKKTSARGKSSKSAPKRTASAPAGLSPRVKSILFVALAVLFAILVLVPGSNFWRTVIRPFFFGIFGLGMLLVPALFIYLCVMNEKEKQIAHFGAKIALCVFTFLFAGAIVYMMEGAKHQSVNFFACIGNLYLDAFNSTKYIPPTCGLIGGILGHPIVAICGSTVGIIISFIMLAVNIFLIANLSVRDVTRAAAKTYNRARQARDRHRERVVERRREREVQPQRTYSSDYPQYTSTPEPQRTEAKPKRRAKLHSADSIDIPIYIGGERQSAIDVPFDEPKTKKKRKKAVKNGLDTDVADPNEQNATDLSKSEDLLNIINKATKPMGENADTTIGQIADDITRGKRSGKYIDGDKDAKRAERAYNPQVTEKPAEPKKQEIKKEKPESEFDNIGYNPNNSYGELKQEKVYHYPPVQLLNLNQNNNDESARAELTQNSHKLIDTLQSFGVNASITNICRGPSVTRYELQPAPGVKISKITNLSDDIALNLAANGVRIEAPIPGKAAVGIEVPNKVVSMVSMRELIDSDVFRSQKSKLATVLGRDISGEIVVADIAKMPHLLVAGTTGSGKSVCVNSMLISILYKASPDEVKLLLIDPKMVEFSKYKGIPHLLVPIVSDAKKAAGALAWAVNEMLQRYKIFSEFDVKDIDSYNSLVEKNLNYISENPPVENEEGEMYQPVMEVNGLPVAKEKMSRVVIAIDELADLMMAAPSEVEDSICRLAQMARAAGMHLILATQRPTVNVITGLIKANVPSRIALKVSSNMDSRTILDAGGGEKLIGRGDMLFSPVGAPKPLRVQGAYASDEEIDRVTSFVKKSFKAEYNKEAEEEIKRIAAEEIAQGKKGKADSDGGDGLDVDSKMDEAIQCVIEAGQASTSLIQRRLKVGYARAGRMIDDMEQLGVVGPHQGSKPRDVLMTYNEWLERRNVLQNKSE